MTKKLQSLIGVAAILAIGVAIGLSLRDDQLPEISSRVDAATTPVSNPESSPREAPDYSPVKARARDRHSLGVSLGLDDRGNADPQGATRRPAVQRL